MNNIDFILDRLSKSTFRNKFHLKDKDKQYIKDKGMDVIREHTNDFINKRLAPAVIANDGKQTPMRGHPVFVAQHACACCCRGCLQKWYKVNPREELSELQQEKIVNLLMAWIQKEMAR
jgi:exodeoxyribonuclease V alpha subunit